MPYRGPRGWLLVCITVSFAIAPAAFYIARRRPQTPWGSPGRNDIGAHPDDLGYLLARANYFYWLHNLPEATPLYARAEALATRSHDERDALYARIGLIRSSDAISFPQLSSFLQARLQEPLAKNDAELR